MFNGKTSDDLQPLHKDLLTLHSYSLCQRMTELSSDLASRFSAAGDLKEAFREAQAALSYEKALLKVAFDARLAEALDKDPEAQDILSRGSFADGQKVVARHARILRREGPPQVLEQQERLKLREILTAACRAQSDEWAEAIERAASAGERQDCWHAMFKRKQAFSRLGLGYDAGQLTFQRELGKRCDQKAIENARQSGALDAKTLAELQESLASWKHYGESWTDRLMQRLPDRVTSILARFGIAKPAA